MAHTQEYQRLVSDLNAISANEFNSIILIDRNFRIGFFNKIAEARAMMVFNKQIRVGQSIHEFVLPAEKEAFDRDFTLALQGNPVAIDREIVDAHGTGHWFSINYSPSFASNGDVVGVAFMAIDINIQKQAERQLLAADAFKQTILDALHVNIAVLDRRGYIVQVNEGWRRFGLDNGISDPAGTIEEVNYLDVLRRSAAAGDADAAPMLDGVQSVLDGGAPFYEQQYRCDSPAERRWFIAKVTPLPHTPGGAVVIHENITRRVLDQLEIQKLSQAVEQSPAMIIITDVHGKTEYVNPAFTSFTQYAFDEIRGKNPSMLNFEGWMTEPHYHRFWETLGSAGYWKGEFRNRKKDGTVYDAAATISSITDHRGVTTHYLSIQEDITEKKRINAELERSNDTLRQLTGHLLDIREKERSSIAREVHDELGQTFTALKMELMALLRQSAPMNEQMSPQASVILRLIESGIRSVQEISSNLRPRILDDLGLLPALEWLVEQHAKRSGLAIHLDLPKNGEDIGTDLATSLFRLTQESLTNVSRHANATDVWVTLHRTHSGLSLRIEDNGRGIRPSERDSPTALGIIGMRERLHPFDGILTIGAHADGGTTVHAIIPITHRGETGNDHASDRG